MTINASKLMTFVLNLTMRRKSVSAAIAGTPS